MSKLEGEFVPLRKDIKEHLKRMSLAEIALFVAYLVLPIQERVETDGSIVGITDPTIDQLTEILPIGRTTIIYAKQALAARGFIKKIGQSKVEIPKFKKYKSSNYEPKSSESELYLRPVNNSKIAKSSKVEPKSSKVEPKSPKVEPSKEEEIELLTTTSGTGQANQTELESLQNPPCGRQATREELESLQKLKGVKDYPFEFVTDLEHLRNLSVDFPEVNIRAEVKKWATYKLDRPLSKRSNPRLQLRNWMDNAIKFRKDGGNGKSKQPAGASSTDKGKYDHLKV